MKYTREDLEKMTKWDLYKCCKSIGLFRIKGFQGRCLTTIADGCLAEIERRGLQAVFLLELGIHVMREDAVKAHWTMGQFWRDDRAVITAALLAVQAAEPETL